MKVRIIATFAAFAAALFFSGCSTPETRITAHLDAFNRLAPAQQEMIKKGEVGLGFDVEMVHLALGEPDHIRTRTDAEGATEVWIYTTWEGPSGMMLYQGWYHRSYPYSGYYPFYMDVPSRHEREHFRVVFKAGKVISIEKETK